MSDILTPPPTATPKTLTGIPFFDKAHGGVYADRCWLLSGSSGTGKSSVALQFAAQGVQQGERCLLLSSKPASDTVLWATSQGLGMGKAIESGQFLVLEYGDFIPGRDVSDPNLPPEGFLDLQEIAHENSIRRVILDTVLPWAMTPHLPSMSKRTLSLVRAFDRLQCTTLLTLPNPVSDPAKRLKQALELVVPITVELDQSLETGLRVWKTVKYLGATELGPPVPYALVPGRGAVASSDNPGRPPAPIPQPGLPPSSGRARLSPAILGRDSTSARAPDRTARYGLSFPR